MTTTTAPPSLVDAPPGRSGRSRLAPWLFLAPFLLTFAVFVLYPLVQSMVLATQQTFGPRSAEFVGAGNFTYLLQDPQFWKAVTNTLIYAAGSVLLQLPCSLGLAMLLNRPSLRGRAFFRLIFFAPALVGLVFVAIIFALMFQKEQGLINVALETLTGGWWDRETDWLGNPSFVMPALILSSLWMYTGFNMVYFLAALQNVDKTLLEAATVDGAGAWDKFVNVTLPAIKPVASFVVLLSLVGSFQLFELPYLLLGNGSGPKQSGLTIVMYLYQTGFESSDLGYASAIGWAMAVMLGVFAVVQRLINRDEDDRGVSKPKTPAPAPRLAGTGPVSESDRSDVEPTDTQAAAAATRNVSQPREF